MDECIAPWGSLRPIGKPNQDIHVSKLLTGVETSIHCSATWPHPLAHSSTRTAAAPAAKRGRMGVFGPPCTWR